MQVGNHLEDGVANEEERTPGPSEDMFDMLFFPRRSNSFIAPAKAPVRGFHPAHGHLEGLYPSAPFERTCA